MRKVLPAAIGIVFAAVFAASAFAEAAPANQDSLNKLLSQVESAGQQDQVLFAQHRAQFSAASPDQQKAMMKQAQAELDQAKAAASQASNQFSANELQAGKLSDQLDAQLKAAGLTGVYTVAQKDAGNLVSSLHDALTNTQFSPPQGEPGRLEFLKNLAAANGNPTLNDLQRLWYVIQREMTAQAQVVRYQAPVVESNNESAVSPVIRIGPFTATSEGRFLRYLPDLDTLAVLSRKLPGGFRSTLDDFQDAKQGYVRAVVDPTSGTIMGMMVAAPTWLERIHLGGNVGIVIIAVGVIGLILFLFQIVRLILIKSAVNKQLKDLDNPKGDNPLGRVLQAFKGDPARIEEEADIAELRITEAVLREEPKLERFQAYLRLAVAAGPLLGLIGTVIGMIETFQTITETGSADPRLMATGIGHAMIATVLGLGVAIPLLFGNALLKSLSDSVMQILDKQSNGMLAGRIERRRGGDTATAGSGKLAGRSDA